MDFAAISCQLSLLTKNGQPSAGKFIKIDGNDMEQIVAALAQAKKIKGVPTCILAKKRLKGKGVSYMENVCEWHGMAPDVEQYNCAIHGLERITGGNGTMKSICDS